MLRRFVVLMVLLLLLAGHGLAQSQTQPPVSRSGESALSVEEQVARDRRYAMDLYAQGKAIEALPWFEKVVAATPNDVEAIEHLAACLVNKAATLSDPVQRKATRIRARQQFLRAKELGDNSDYLQAGLAGLPEDGRDPEYASNPEVDRLMKQGEAAFGANKLDDAKNAYLSALLLDPNNYAALLFIGDVYFRKGDATAAGEWFSRAIQVQPAEETAYRYWGDALLKQQKFAAARDKFIDAVIASPYDQHSWSGINNYLHVTKQKATWYKIQSPNSFSTSDKGGTINLDTNSVDKKDGSSAWIAYPMERILWKNEKFAKEYPKEKQYRHSLKEESAALSVVASVASELSSGKKAEKLNADLQVLVKLKSAGFLDSYILINVPDQGIVQDYVEYREAHREILVRYLREVVVPAAPADSGAQ